MRRHATMFAGWSFVLMTIIGCENAKKAPPPAKQPVSSDASSAEPAKSTGPATMPNPDASLVKISPAEATAHHLPPAEITLNTAGKNLEARKFPAENQYLALSGPPGGPLGLVLEHVTNS